MYNIIVNKDVFVISIVIIIDTIIDITTIIIVDGRV